VDFGIDRLLDLDSPIRRLGSARLGVLAHAASVDRRLRHLGELLHGVGIRPALLFAPEHGFAAAAQDMAAVGREHEPLSGAAIVSLYGEHAEELAPRPEHLAQIDLLLVDLVDVGSRYYTFVWTALLAVRAAAAAGVHCIVLDRPNPLGGLAGSVEGRSQEPGFLSFVGLEPVPIRHSLTLAELLALHAAADGLALGPDGALSVVPVRGWQRAEQADDWDRPFVPPSPNMPSPDTALVYPGGCLLEGTNLSEGRGHTRPFEVVGAPWLDGARLARALESTGLPGFVARPMSFVPTFHKHAGERCGGVQIHPVDPASFRPVATYLALVTLAHAQRPDAFRFRTERYEFVDDIPAFDLLTGSAEARQAILAGEDARAVGERFAEADPAWPERMAQARAAVERAAWRG
jgi:uncharacterized protein YbbC (DUF1343 family)